MSESFERYAIERDGSAIRITFDQRRGAVVNFACGLIMAVFGYWTEASAGTVVMWVGIGWALLAARAYSHERVTELGDILTYSDGKNVRSLARSKLTDLVLRLHWHPRRNKKQGVLPWAVEVWGDDPEPFVTYSFQEEEPARAFATRLGEILHTMPSERIERSDSVAA